MSNQPTPGVYIELAYNSNAFFSDSRKGDVCFRTANSNQRILFGVNTNAPALFGMDSSNLIMKGNISLGGSNNPSEVLDIRNGNAYFDSNVYVMNKFSIGSTMPSEYFDLLNGNAKMSSNLYVMNQASIGVTNSNPTETLDVGSNLKVRSNAYVMYRVAIGKSNPREAFDVEGNAKFANNVYALQNLSVGTSNPRENVDILLNAIIRSNAYIMSKISVGSSNPTETLDIIGNEKITGRLFVTSNIGAGTSNPTERLDVYDNTKIRGDLYALNRIVIGQGASNPNETLDVRGNTKIGANFYVLSNVSIGNSNPTEKLDVVGNTKVQGNIYTTTRIGVGNSNPGERIDVSGNILASSNMYAMQSIGIGTVFPNERLEVTGNAKVLSNLYVVQKVGIGNSNPEEKVHISGGNTKIDQNLYVMSQIGVGKSNPTEAIDILGNLKLSGNIYSMNNLAVGLSNPSEQIETGSNLKVGSNLYVISRLGVGTSNLTETADIIGNLKVSSNIYTSNAIVIGGRSNPTEKLDLVGNAKVSSNLYVLSNVSIAHSNPTEKLDIIGNLKVSSNIYTSNAIVIGGGSNPTEKLHLTGNAKISSNLYVLNRLSINSSNPSVGLEVNTTDAVLLSKGTIAQRPSVPVLGHMRYNTETSQFEGFGAGNAWGSLGGVKSTNQQTYISAEEYPTSNDDIIRFFNSNIESMRITRARLIGIGTTSPTEKLDIIGNVKISSNEYIMGSLGINTSNMTEKLQVTSGKIYTDTQFLANSNDSVLLPSYSFKEDSNTGIFHASNDAIGFTTNGTEKMRIDVNGNLGLGITNPSYKLDINGSINALGYCNLLLDSYSSISTSNAPTVNALKTIADTAFFTSNMIFSGGSNGAASLATLATSASNTAFWSSNNLVKKGGDTMTGTLITPFVGVNTLSPSERVDITGNIKVSSNVYVSSRIGVNTSNPSQAIHVVGNMRLEGNLDVNGILNTINTDVQLTDQVTVSNNGTGPALKVYQIGAQPVADFYDDTTLAMRIADGGNVGIGTSTPSHKLDVAGTSMRIQGGTGNTPTILYINPTNVSNTTGVLQFVSSGHSIFCTDSNNYSGYSNIGGGHNIYYVSGGHNFSGNIYAANSIGIGTTTPVYKLDVNGTSRIKGSWTNGASNLLVLENQTGSRIQFVDEFGSVPCGMASFNTGNGLGIFATTQIGFYTSNISSSNAVQRMTITQAGDVGVGTTSPAFKLDVNGKTRIQAPSGSNILTVQTNNNAIGEVAGIMLGIPSGQGATIESITGPANVTDLRFWTTASNLNVTSNMTMFLSGNSNAVGIGTTNPLYKLDVAGTINSSGNLTGPTITSLSNLGMFSSNTSISASNTVISLSNYVYTTSSTNVTTANAIAISASNTAFWSSNNLVKKSGDTMTGNLDVTGNGGVMISALHSSMVFGQNAAISMGKAKSTNNIANIRYSHSNDGSTSNYVGIGFWGNDDILNVRASGNVGIGTVTPVSKLDVWGQLTLCNDGGWTSGGIRFRSTNGTVDGAIVQGNNGGLFYRSGALDGANGHNWVNGGASSTLMTLTNAGNLGIGNTSPTYKLDVVTANSTDAVIRVGDSVNQCGRIMLGNSSHGIARGASIAGANDGNDVTVHTSGFGSVTLATGAGEVLRVNNLGNTGIGTANPGYKLDVSGDQRITGGLYFGPPTGDIAPYITARTVPVGQGEANERTEMILFHGNDPANGSGTDTITLRAPGLRFQTYNDATVNHINNSNGALDRMYIDPTGNVGISTVSPTTKLEINGNVLMSSNDGYIGLTTGANGPSLGMIKKSGVAPTFAFTSNYINGNNTNAMRFVMLPGFHLSNLATNTPTEYMTLTNAGNLGINNSTPTYRVDVTGDIRATSNYYISSTYGTNYIGVGTADNATLCNYNVKFSSWWGIGFPSFDGINRVTMDTRTGNLITMGNISVGTSNTSSYKVDVTGSCRILSTSATNGMLHIINPNNAESSFCMSNSSATAVIGLGAFSVPTTSLSIWGSITVAGGAGNVGIGTTSPAYKLDVQGIVGINASGKKLQFANDSATNRHIVLWENANNEHQYYGFGVNSDTLRYQVDANGRHVFFCGASSTSSTELMRIQGNGTVGIGTSTPSSSYKLDVNGNLNATTIYQNGVSLSGSYLPLSGGTLTNTLTITETTGSAGSASSGTLTLKHNNSGGSSSIVFTSTVNAGSDYAYIRYSDHDISTYFPAQTGTTECSRLTIGVENDGDFVGNGETVVIKGQYGIVFDAARHFFTGGNVGIGNSAPSQKLHVDGGNCLLNNAFIGDVGFGSTHAGFRHSSVGQSSYGLLQDNAGITFLNCASGKTICFRENNNDKMTLSNSCLGIGTTAPTAPLHVIAGSSGEPNNNGVYVYNPTSTTSSHAVVGVRVNNSTGGNPFYSWDIANVTGWSMGVSNADSDKLVIKSVWNFIGDNNIMTFVSGGNVGIATTNPSYKLDVVGDIRASGEIISTSANSFRMVQGNYGIFGRNDGTDFYLLITASGSPYGGWNSLRPLRVNLASGGVYIADNAIYAANGGNVGVGTTSPGSYKLYVSGEIYATSDITAYSDIRAKSNLEKIPNPLEKIQQINGYTYDFNTDEPSQTKITQRYAGLVAQEVEKILPEVIHKNDDGKLSIAYGNMAGLFVESIKELKKENTELRTENQLLKDKLTTIEDKVTRLETLLSSIIN